MREEVASRSSIITGLAVDGNLPDSIRDVTPHLTELYITSLPQLKDLAILTQFPQLKRLYLRYNDLEAAPEVIHFIFFIKELYISYTALPDHGSTSWAGNTSEAKDDEFLTLPAGLDRLQRKYSLPKRLSQLTNLQKLVLSNNPLVSVPEVVTSLVSLKELDMSNCQLTTLPESLSALTSLSKLKLSRNPISSLPKTVTSLTSLTHLDVSWCALDCLPTSLCHLNKLRKLNLSHNKLRQLNEVVMSLKTLTHLDLSWCSLSDLPDTIGGLTELVALDVSRNQFTTISSHIAKLSNLKTLNVAENHDLTSLTEVILQMGNLNEIDAFGCTYLVSPPYGVCQQGFKAIKQYYLDKAKGSVVKIPVVTVAVIGQSFSGKTSLIKTLQNEDNSRVLSKRIPGSKNDETTRVFKMEEVKVGPSALKFIDFGGHEIYQLAYQLTLKHNCLPLIVVNIKQYEQMCSEVGENEAVRSLFFDWLSHLYSEIPELNSPILVLTHKDKCERKIFADLKTSFMQACDKVLDIIRQEETSHKLPRIFYQPSLFTPEKTFEIGNDVEDNSEYAQLKALISRLSSRFEQEIPEIWQNVGEKLTNSYTSPCVSFKQICVDMSTAFETEEEQLGYILTYLHNCGQILWYKENKKLKQNIFQNVSCVTTLVNALYHHDQDEWAVRVRSSLFIPTEDDFHLEEVEKEESLQKFLNTGVMERKFLHFLIVAQTKFKVSERLDIALNLLESYRLIHGPENLMDKESYILPYFANGYFSKMLDEPLKRELLFHVELQFHGLALPEYVYYQMGIGLLRFCPSRSVLSVKKNGISIKTEIYDILLVYDMKSRKASIELSFPSYHIVDAWEQITEITNHLVTYVCGVWKSSGIECRLFCPHCLLKKDPYPEKALNPSWCHLPVEPDKEAYLHMVDHHERTSCKSDSNIPFALLSPCKYYSDNEKTELVEYINDCTLNAQLKATLTADYGLAEGTSSQSTTTNSEVGALHPPPITPEGADEVDNEEEAAWQSIMEFVNSVNCDSREDDTDQISHHVDLPTTKTEPIIDKYPSPTSPEIKQWFFNTKEAYSTSKHVRGRALVINNYSFPQAAPREGSQFDLQNIETMLRRCKLVVDVKKNLNAQEMRSAIYEETRNPHHDDHGLFFLVLMAHGCKENIIYGSDGKEVDLTDIYNLINSVNFPHMKGKPKVVIVQACRTENPGRAVPKARREQTQLKGKSNVEDLLIFRSCFEGCASIRFKHIGSLFIRTLVTSMYKLANQHDLFHIFEIVQHEVNEATKELAERNPALYEQQTPIITKTLTKLRKVFLFPEYNGE